MGTRCGSFKERVVSKPSDALTAIDGSGLRKVGLSQARRGITALSSMLVGQSIGRSRRAASRSVSVLAIVVGAVAFAIAVTGWMQASTTEYTRLEALRPRGSWTARLEGGLVVVCKLENTGTKTVAVVDVMLDGEPFGNIGSAVSVVVSTPMEESVLDADTASTYVGILPGQTANLEITMYGSSVPNGNVLRVGIMTSGGQEYVQMVPVH